MTRKKHFFSANKHKYPRYGYQNECFSILRLIIVLCRAFGGEILNSGLFEKFSTNFFLEGLKLRNGGVTVSIFTWNFSNTRPRT